MSFEQMLHHGKGVIKSQLPYVSKDLLDSVVGIAVITEFKGAWFVSGKLGRGFICKRISSTEFSSPSSIVLGGAGIGAQWGAEKIDLMYLFLSESELDAFTHSGHIALGGETGFAIGKGTTAQSEMTAAPSGLSSTFAMGSSQGAYIGFSVEGTLLFSSPISNRMFYGRAVGLSELLSSQIAPKKSSKAELVRSILRLLSQAVTNRLPNQLSQRILPIDSDEEEELASDPGQVESGPSDHTLNDDSTNYAEHQQNGVNEDERIEQVAKVNVPGTGRVVKAPSGHEGLNLYVLNREHIFDTHAARVHHILSLPSGSLVRVLHGDMEHGLGGKYADYVEVETNINGQTQVGKVSRYVLDRIDQPARFPSD